MGTIQRTSFSDSTSRGQGVQALHRKPSHPSLNLKKVGPFWSARISLEYRVLGYRQDREFFWFWIGPHDEYVKIIKLG